MTVVCMQCGECFSAQDVETSICPECGSIVLLPVDQNSQPIYDKAITKLNSAREKLPPLLPWPESRDAFVTAQRLFQAIPGYLDADQQAELCRQTIAEQDHIVEEQIRFFIDRESNKSRRIMIAILPFLILGAILMVVLFVLLPSARYLLQK